MKKYFVTGLILLLPAALTLAIFLFLIDLLTKPFLEFTSHFIARWDLFPDGFSLLSQDQVIDYVSKVLILVSLFFFTTFLGLITKPFFTHSFIHLCDQILLRIPLLNTIYKTSKEIIQTLLFSDKNAFKQVVLAPFPRDGVYVIGLITSKTPSSWCEQTKQELISVLVPTTPNPTSGFLLMIPEKQLIYLDIKTEEALKYIISCGVITPTGGA